MIVVMLDIAKAFQILAVELRKRTPTTDRHLQPITALAWINALHATAERIRKDEQEERKPTRHLDI